MRGRRTKWILGTDHAGIATQKQVERAARGRGHEPRGDRPRGVRRARLAVARAVRRHDHRAVQAPRRHGGLRRRALHARRALRAGGHEGLRRPLRQGPDLPRPLPGQLGPRVALGHLRPRGRGPRGHRQLFHIAYPLEDGGGEIVVATVRPETMLADTAVAVHPDDERYRHLVGATAVLPLVGRHLTIIADDYVKTDFGTGALKITPGHDPNDFEIGRRHEPRRDLGHRRGRAHDGRGGPRLRRASRSRRRARRSSPRSTRRASSATASPTPTPCPSATARASASSR